MPRQLPAATAHFVNRVEELAQLDAYLAHEARDQAASAVRSQEGAPARR